MPIGNVKRRYRTIRRISSAPSPCTMPEYTAPMPHCDPRAADIHAARSSTNSAAPGLRMMRPPRTPPISQIPTAIPPRPGVRASIALVHKSPGWFHSRKMQPQATARIAAVTKSTTRQLRRGFWSVIVSSFSCMTLKTRTRREPSFAGFNPDQVQRSRGLVPPPLNPAQLGSRGSKREYSTCWLC